MPERYLWFGHRFIDTHLDSIADDAGGTGRVLIAMVRYTDPSTQIFTLPIADVANWTEMSVAEIDDALDKLCKMDVDGVPVLRCLDRQNYTYQIATDALGVQFEGE